MKKTMLVMTMALGLALSTAALAFASYSQDVVYEHDFTDGIGDWTDGDGAYGSIVHNAGDGTATVDGAESGLPYGPYSFFGEDLDRTVWPEHGYITELDVYLDPAAMGDGDGFDLSVASYREGSGTHLRDFIIHVGKVDGDLLVNGSNNSDWQFNPLKLTNQAQDPATITDTGWYTLQHSFYDQDGSLAVDLNLLDADGDAIFTATRHNTDDAIDGVVGGVGYQWFVYASAPFDVDNQLLANNVPTPDAPEDKRDCMQGGYDAFGFVNQGQCVASVQANDNAGK